MPQFITIEKDGHEEQISIEAWELMGANNNKYGWRVIASEPPEVQEIKHKKSIEMKKISLPEGETKEEKTELVKEVKSKPR